MIDPVQRRLISLLISHDVQYLDVYLSTPKSFLPLPYIRYFTLVLLTPKLVYKRGILEHLKIQSRRGLRELKVCT